MCSECETEKRTETSTAQPPDRCCCSCDCTPEASNSPLPARPRSSANCGCGSEAKADADVDATCHNDGHNQCGCSCSCGNDQESLVGRRARIIVALIIFVAAYALELSGTLDTVFGASALYAEFALFLIPFTIAGYDVLIEAARNLARGRGLDESFLMSIATIGAFSLVLFPNAEPHMAEGAAVMIFYQIGELFQSYAVGKTRKSIANMMDIVPEFANIQENGQLKRVSPSSVSVGSLIVVKPGERIPLDGIVTEGTSRIDTAALTGEPAPRTVRAGNEVISGCINLTGAITVNVTSPYESSTVSRILELVEKASERKARTESFITRFARYYTPIVVGLAAAIAIIPPVAIGITGGGNAWADWVLRGLTFLVVSCPCALVISVPLSFFGGIGGASRAGILIKGSNYLEMLSKVDTVVFDKTGTLTSGVFAVTDISIPEGASITRSQLLDYAAHAEATSNHPIAISIQRAHGKTVDLTRIAASEEIGGHGVSATIDGTPVLVGNSRLMQMHGVEHASCELIGTQVHIAIDGTHAGTLVVGDIVKPDSRQAIDCLHAEGVARTVMLTGDAERVGQSVAQALNIDACRTELLPAEKVGALEELIAQGKRVAFVGDGINDAPALMRADVGIAMGAMGSDAAIEAADIVLMDDRPTQVARAIRISKRTMRIVRQNIVFALGVKLAVLLLAALGIANMWMAVFADVGVAVLAILNAMRAMHVKPIRERA